MLYVDTSATVKLLVEEAESAALTEFLVAAATPLATSRVGIVELRRAGRRSGVEADRVDAVASALVVVELDAHIGGAAAELDPALRTLDAIHLATAQAIGEQLEGFVCYDSRLAAAAADEGMAVFAPRA